MTKFEQIGINFQNHATTKECAIKAFEQSCNMCCLRGIRIECDRCSIAVVHKMTLAALEERK